MINVGMLAKIRRMHLRDGLSIREISRSTGLSRNTVKRWLRQEGVIEPRYAPRAQRSVLDPWVAQLEAALRVDAYRACARSANGQGAVRVDPGSGLSRELPSHGGLDQALA